jgi:leader peptidase (prepilin peptidase)/N-methyltransferase
VADPLYLATVGVFGLAIGSFLNVVIWRVPRSESIVRPGSRCPACRAPIPGRDNIPVLSWLALRGRCRACHEPISARYPAVELATGGLFVLMAWHFGEHPATAAYLYLVAVGVALALIDIDHKRLPDALTLPSYPVGLALLGVATAARGHPGDLVRGVLGMAVLFAVYAVIVVVYPAGMGLGDLKLSGVYLAWVGWGALAVGAFAAFLIGGVVGVALLAAGAGRKAKIPFGPYMLAGALVGILAGQQLWHGYTHALH